MTGDGWEPGAVEAMVIVGILIAYWLGWLNVIWLNTLSLWPF